MFIAFDLDGCIVDFSSSMMIKLYEETEIPMRLEELTEYKLSHISDLGVSQDYEENLIDRLLRDQTNFATYPGALGFLYQYFKKYHQFALDQPLLERGYKGKLTFITSRREEFRNETERWLAHNIPGIPYRLFMTKSKLEKCIDLKVDYFVEDNAEFFFKFIADKTLPPDRFNTTIVVPRRPWNAKFLNETRGNPYVLEFTHWPMLNKLFNSRRT